MLNFNRLHTPPEDGAVLIEPPPEHWPDLLATNKKILQDNATLMAGMPLNELRRRVRERLGLGDADQPVLAAGHQPAYVHPGVWAKHVALRHGSEKLNAIAIDFVVDNDAPKSADLLVPTLNEDGLIELNPIEMLGNNLRAAYEGRAPLSSEQIDHARAQTLAALPEESANTMISQYFEGLKQPADPCDAVCQHLAGRQRIDSQLAADVREIRVSRAFGGHFVADLLLQAERFADSYNRALADYRKTEQVRSADRPLPDLVRLHERVETALWVYQPGKTRRRLSVRVEKDRIILFADNEKIGTLGCNDLAHDPEAALRSLEPWRIRPRALTLTLWARLLACDFFIHGIGGAKYDRITDRIMQDYYRCRPPAYACVSATLYLPLPHRPTCYQEVPQARRRLRDVHFNPDRYLSSPPADLLEKRRTLIEQSATLRRQQAPRRVRHENWSAIRQVNRQLVESEPGLIDRLEHEYQQTIRQVESNRLADGREYFYALQPQSRLNMLGRKIISYIK